MPFKNHQVDHTREISLSIQDLRGVRAGLTSCNLPFSRTGMKPQIPILSMRTSHAANTTSIQLDIRQTQLKPENQVPSPSALTLPKTEETLPKIAFWLRAKE